MEVNAIKIVWVNSLEVELLLMADKKLGQDDRDIIYQACYTGVTPVLKTLLPKSRYPKIKIVEDWNECSSTDPDEDAAFYDYGEEYGVDTNPSDDIWLVSGLKMTREELITVSIFLSEKLNPDMRLSIRIKGCDRSAWITVQNGEVCS